MGVGLDPADLLEAIEQGVDMFDCVAPTRLARHGMLFCHCEERDPSLRLGTGSAIPKTAEDCRAPKGARDDKNKHRINITNSVFAKDAGPIDPSCHCPTCQNYSRSYLHHLFGAQEMTAMRLASIHNLYFLLDLMRQTREAIKQDKFLELKQNWR